MSKPSVLIAVPSSDKVDAGFAMSLAQLTAVSIGKFELVLSNVRNASILDTRNKLAEIAKEADTDYILWIDADMEFPPNSLSKLHSQGKDIIGTNYPRREYPFGSISAEAEGIYEVDGMGFGLVLMKTSILNSLQKPWFYVEYKDPEDLSSYVTSDYYFCGKVREQGYKIWIDGELSKEIGHVASRTLRL